jgi:CheY-like chemotaxis protein
MDIVQGMDYSIIEMPQNLSADAVDGAVAEIVLSAQSHGGGREYLLDMEKIPQLHRAGLVFITRLQEMLAGAGCTLSIAGLREPVENALRFHRVAEKVPLYSTIIDFERQKELVFDVKTAEVDAIVPDKPAAGPRKEKYNVLILDPSIAVRNNQKSVFAKLPVDNLIEAKDAIESLKRLRSVPFGVDLVVADMTALKPDVEEYVRCVRALPPCSTTKIIVTTTDANSSQSLQNALQAGIDDSINRNYGVEEMRRLLDKLAEAPTG